MHYSELEISVKFVNDTLKGAFINNIYRHKYGTLIKLYGSDIKGLFFSREKKAFFPVMDIAQYKREEIGNLEESFRKYINGRRITGAATAFEFGKAVIIFLGEIKLIIRLSNSFLPLIVENTEILWPANSFFPEKISVDLKYFQPLTDNPLKFSDIFLTNIKNSEENEILRLYNKEKANIEKNIALFKAELEKADIEGEICLNKASLLKMWLYSLDSSSRLKNVSLYNMDGVEVNINLNPAKTVLENMNHLFKLASKYKTGKLRAQDMLEKYESKLNILSIENISIKKDEPSELKRKELFIHKPYHVYITSWGSVFFVGKNASDNDELTFKISSPHDFWFHAKDYSGSHVILRRKKNEQLTERDVNVGCMLAVNYSKAKKGGEGEVWYSERKFIRKSKGMAHGAVLITRGKSRYVVFDQKIMDTLNKE